MSTPEKCRCLSATHGHASNACDNLASHSDHLCDACHEAAAAEAAAAITPLNQPPQRDPRWHEAVMSAWWQGTPTGMPATLRQPPNLPEEHPFYALVGRVASEWAHLEHILDTTIWELLGVKPELAACVTSQIMGAGPRCKAIMTLGFARKISEDVLKPYRKLMNESYSTADWRARFVHDPWYVEAGSGGASQFRAMPYVDMRFGKHDIDKAELEATIQKIKNLQNRAAELRKSVLNAFEASSKNNA